ncbi:MAG: hypothetical protein WBG50_00275 [Desulfomonilaceae bacterium]
MAIELIFAIVMLVLAVLLFGTVLLVRNRRKGIIGSSFGFKDCYDLCLDEPDQAETSRSCKTMCISYGGA